MFTRENRFLVLKWSDINNYLSKDRREDLQRLVREVELRRIEANKPANNSYVVINEDEPYAEIVWKLVEISQVNPEGLPRLLKNLEVELAGF